jgi:DNA-binding LacI/PurR family transcriptional regulator
MVVLRGSPLVSEEAKAAVLAAITELGYRPNAAARTLAHRRSHSIGVLVSDLHNPFFPMVLDGIDALAEYGRRVPEDVSVAGYDNTAVAAFRQISLTTVEQFATEIGAEAMRSVLARVERRDRPARHIMVPPRLVERATTGPPRLGP